MRCKKDRVALLEGMQMMTFTLFLRRHILKIVTFPNYVKVPQFSQAENLVSILPLLSWKLATRRWANEQGVHSANDHDLLILKLNRLSKHAWRLCRVGGNNQWEIISMNKSRKIFRKSLLFWASPCDPMRFYQHKWLTQEQQQDHYFKRKQDE